MKVIVAGSRTFNSYYKLRDKLNSILRNQKDITIISGTASGADRLGERYATENHYELEKSQLYHRVSSCIIHVA